MATLAKPVPPSPLTDTSVRVCHYGTGAFADSPVLLTFPERVVDEQDTILTTVEFAEAFREAYEAVATPAELQDLRANVANLVVRHWRKGHYDTARLAAQDLIRYWRSKNLCSFPDYPTNKTVEEDLQDKLGRLAAAGEFDFAVGGHYSETWMDSTYIFDGKRAAIDTAALAGLASAAGSVLASSADPAHAIWFGLGLFFLRFSKPFNKHVKGTPLQCEAYRLYPGDAKAKRALARRMARGMSNEATFAEVARALTEARLQEASVAAAERVVAELSPLDYARSEPERSLMAAFLEDHAVDKAPSWELLQAQRALLTELKELKG